MTRPPPSDHDALPWQDVARRDAAIGRVLLKDGTVVIGAVGEPFRCEGRREGTSFVG